jgi:exodeoxyribonuclease VII large subunit
MMPQPEERCTLSELLTEVKGRLRSGFPGSYWVAAEILELHENRSGHCYLELVEKEADTERLIARSRAVIWSSRYRMLRPYFETSTGTRLKSGIKLLVKVSVEFHEQYGFSLQITDMDPAYTLGDLALKKQEVIRRLREAGVMEMNRELPFPMVPQRIAVISSENAAGYGDFMESLHHNPHGFSFRSTLFPAAMQGDESVPSLINALDQVFESEPSFDCVVLIRGGGNKALA